MGPRIVCGYDATDNCQGSNGEGPRRRALDRARVQTSETKPHGFKATPVLTVNLVAEHSPRRRSLSSSWRPDCLPRRESWRSGVACSCLTLTVVGDWLYSDLSVFFDVLMRHRLGWLHTNKIWLSFAGERVILCMLPTSQRTSHTKYSHPFQTREKPKCLSFRIHVFPAYHLIVPAIEQPPVL